MRDAALRIPEHVVSREVGGETVILNLETGDYYGLNAVGAAIWRGIEAQSSRDEIVGAVQAEFESTVEVITQDMDALLADLRKQGLLED